MTQDADVSNSNVFSANIVLEVPRWLDEFMQPQGYVFKNDAEKMELAIRLAKKNSEADGGPFGAAIFDRNSNQLLAVGVNRVVANCCSVAHAEIMAIMSAQQRQKKYSLAEGGGSIELVTSTEPCAQCFGAIPWAGLNRLVCGARSIDAEEIGFDEGPKPHDWIAQLQKRNIEVCQDVLRDEAKAVLQAYHAAGKLIYGGKPIVKC